MRIPDHFSPQAAGYARYRPGYPAELFSWLAGVAPGRALAWDCATGSGQAAVALAEHFGTVVASDVSLAQVSHAATHPRVHYTVAAAEASGIAGGQVELVTVAQAFHWFQPVPFHAEVRRVLRPGGVLAVWSYELMQVTPEVDAVVTHLYGDLLGPWWPPERRHVENGYRELPFPYGELQAPPFRMEAQWPLEALLGYLATWSALRYCREGSGRDALAEVTPALAAAWGDETMLRPVRWPLNLRVGRIE